MTGFNRQEFGNTISQFPDHHVLSAEKPLQGGRWSMILDRMLKTVKELPHVVSEEWDMAVNLCLCSWESCFPLFLLSPHPTKGVKCKRKSKQQQTSLPFIVFLKLSLVILFTILFFVLILPSYILHFFSFQYSLKQQFIMTPEAAWAVCVCVCVCVCVRARSYFTLIQTTRSGGYWWWACS